MLRTLLEDPEGCVTVQYKKGWELIYTCGETTHKAKDRTVDIALRRLLQIQRDGKKDAGQVEE
jgi:hypothetical protein